MPIVLVPGVLINAAILPSSVCYPQPIAPCDGIMQDESKWYFVSSWKLTEKISFSFYLETLKRNFFFSEE